MSECDFYNILAHHMYLIYNKNPGLQYTYYLHKGYLQHIAPNKWNKFYLPS